MQDSRISLSVLSKVTTMANNISFLFRLRVTYRANSVINILKSIPLIKKLMPKDAYDNRNLKALAHVIAIMMEFSSIFVGKILYILAFLVLPLYLDFLDMENMFVHFFIAGAIAGGLANSRFDNATRDSYYAVFFIRMPARDYALTELTLFTSKMFIGFLPFAFVAMFLFFLDPLTVLIIPFFVVCIKMISAPFMLWYGTKIDSATGRSWLLIGIAAMVMGAATIAALFGYVLPSSALLILFVPAALGAIVSYFKLKKFDGFKEYYKKVFSTDTIVLGATSADIKKQAMEKSFKKQITDSPSITSNKEGFGYFNDLFVKRHRKVLMRVASVIAVFAAVIMVTLVVLVLLFPDESAEIGPLISEMLPYFLMIMYAINCSNRISYTMFANCDEAMLKYGFYKAPKSILVNFTHRLRSVIAINLLPGTIIALGLPLLVLASGGTQNPLDYLIIFTSIISMSIFFSVHGMVLYYLFQPYNSKMEIKSPLFSIINMLTYFVCFFAIGERIPLLLFGITMIAFCIVYVAVALILVYRLAPKTFKLRG